MTSPSARAKRSFSAMGLKSKASVSYTVNPTLVRLWPVAQGTYIDDHLIFAICPTSFAQKPGLDTERALKARVDYEKAKLPISEDTCYNHKPKFIAWGTGCCSGSGMVGAPVERRLQLLTLTLTALSLPVLTKAVLQSLLGSLIHPFMHRKCCMSVFGRVYRFVQNIFLRNVL